MKNIAQEQVREQYKDAGNLNARIALHARFSTAKQGWQAWLFEQIQGPENAQVLELGCGPGNLWAHNAERIPAGWQITLTDFSPGMIETAQKNLAELEHDFAYQVVDAMDIPWPDDSFDIVIANHMLYHVPDRQKALMEIRRVLKPSGTLYASTVGEGHMLEMWSLLNPFVGNIMQHLQKVSRTFTLENGGAQLEKVFSHVERFDYPDSLAITEAEPVIAYMQSSATLMELIPAPAMFDRVRQAVSAEINAHGAFHVKKSSGLFIAT